MFAYAVQVCLKTGFAEVEKDKLPVLLDFADSVAYNEVEQCKLLLPYRKTNLKPYDTYCEGKKEGDLTDEKIT